MALILIYYFFYVTFAIVFTLLVFGFVYFIMDSIRYLVDNILK